MKIHLIIALTAAALIGSASTATAQQTSLNAVYQEGVRLYKAEEYIAALEKFEAVKQARPDFVYARSYIKKCKAALANGKRNKNALQAKLAQIVVPEVSLENAPIGDVLDYLSARARQLTDDRVAPNFIYKGSSEQRQNTLISLTLRNVPMTEVIRYVGQLGNTHFSYEEHAVVADPNYNPAPNPAIQKALEAESSRNTLFGEPATTKSIFD